MIKIPDWKNSLSVFDSQPLKLVLEELKNYYQVDIVTSDVNTNKIFTGSFSHQNLEIALNSITLPLGLSYNIDGETVFLSNK
jgi:ferric-dicitrate binding protein FerR (iron transport regulator)